MNAVWFVLIALLYVLNFIFDMVVLTAIVWAIGHYAFGVW